MHAVRQATSIPLAAFSYVHERTYVMEDGRIVNAYDHTHAAVIFKTRIQLKGSRKFDVYTTFDDSRPVTIFHPHIQPKVSATQMEQIFLKYHRGWKLNEATGKMDYTEPILLEQWVPAAFQFTEEIIQEVVQAETLTKACIAGGIRPRTVMDAKTLRAEEPERKRPAPHKFPADSYRDIGPRDFMALHIHGASGLGKTKWALSRRAPEKVCLIKPFNSIGCLEALSKRFNPSVHELVVFDEVDLRFLTREQIIALMDADDECTLDVRFKSFTLPPVQKIFISNPPPEALYPVVFGTESAHAIERRMHFYHLTAPAWRAVAPRPQFAVTSPPVAGTPMGTPPTQAPNH